MTVTAATFRAARVGGLRPSAVAFAGAALTAATVAFTLAASAPDERLEAGLAFGLMVGVPCVIAAWALHRRPGDRFALKLLATALLLAVTALAVSSDSVVYSIGRTAVWFVEPALVYLLLAFPSGRLTAPLDRALFRTVLAVAALLYLPSALVVEHFPEPSPWTTCGVSCPPNAFAVTGSEPALIEAAVRPLREVLTAAVWLGVVVVLARRWRGSIPLGRRTLAPVLGTAALRALALPAYQIARRHGRVGPLVDALGWMYLLSLPLIALGFGAGLVAARLYVATALERLTRRARAGAATSELRATMADALEDPALRVAYQANGVPGRWVDEDGRPVAALRAGDGRAVTEVGGSGRVAAVDHDAVLGLEPGIVHGAGAYALALLETNRLVAQHEARLRELWASRARILSVGDDVRRTIERDLHDGAQQRLVALRASLALESEGLRGERERLAALLDKLGRDVEDTIDDVRSIARGIYPALLADAGLEAALRGAALGAPLHTTVHSDGIGRYDAEIETAVYFTCVEALQNAAKHAHGATRVSMTLRDDGRLRFEVRDDGAGFDARARRSSGAGLTNMADRIAALGGVLTIESEPGAGTQVVALVPLPPPPPPISGRVMDHGDVTRQA